MMRRIGADIRRNELAVDRHQQEPDDRCGEVERDARRDDERDGGPDEPVPEFAEVLDERELLVARLGGHPSGSR